MCYELDKRLNDGSFAKRQSFAGSLCDCTNHLPYNFYYGNYSYTFFVADHSLLQKMDEVKDMRNIIKTEFLKLKRYSVIKAGIIMATLSPLLSLFYSTANGGQTWTFDYFMQQVMISNCTLFFPIIITLIAGYIITREYTDDTMKNISTIPISYRQLLSGKLLVLLLLTICFSFIGCVIALAINIIAGFPGAHFGNLFNLFIRVTGANIGLSLIHI